MIPSAPDSSFDKETWLGYGQYHLAVAGGCEANVMIDKVGLRTHPLPRGGTDPVQVTFLSLEVMFELRNPSDKTIQSSNSLLWCEA